ncbi:hypothetical protein SAMN04488539_1673 [Corynebacterium timonense]|uniref:Excreted virulence factor EspC, type VII ESX diderm n=2 Tax=Corynebacterium timonense TaxID=441500 RepID=A0A1H1S6A6_9CORY|nr:hypothetical protein SAMN04488539_1673 [Corynebacterium timonense]
MLTPGWRGEGTLRPAAPSNTGMRPTHSAPLPVFHLSPPAVSALTGSLRDDAARLTPLDLAPPPAVGPLRDFAHACAGAVASVNERTVALRGETERLAAAMDATAEAAVAVDARLGRALGAMLP